MADAPTEEPPDRGYIGYISMSLLEAFLTGGAELNNMRKLAKTLKITQFLNNLQNTGPDCALTEQWSLFQLLTKEDRISLRLSWGSTNPEP